MSCRWLRLLAVPVMALVTPVLAATPVAGQSRVSDTARRQAEVLPTPWGDPDLQGIWTSSGATPMERPDEYQGREKLSNEEVALIRSETAARDQQLLVTEAQRTTVGGNVGAYNNFWMDRGARTNRTSMLVDPPDGRFPPLTAAGEVAKESRPRGDDTWEDRHIWERWRHARRDAQCHVSSLLQQQHAGVSGAWVCRDGPRAGP